MSDNLTVDAVALREDVKDKYRAVAADPGGTFHFHTGRPLGKRLGYDEAVVDPMPDSAVEFFAGAGNPFELRTLETGEKVVDMGTGAGFDSFIAASQVGASCQVVGVDMTHKSRAKAKAMGANNIEFREGLIEELPIDDGWADVVISNGVINLCPEKQHVFGKIVRVLRPGGTLQFADIANGKSVPASAIANIDLWTS
jgi:arsenite methyltransferase